eukprot:Clim_evm82s11 gene=Clim_evmTU82s11
MLGRLMLTRGRPAAAFQQLVKRNLHTSRVSHKPEGMNAVTAYQYPQSLYALPPTEITTLGNGLRIATESTASETCTVGVFILTGSRVETPENNGVAHFLEHMAFKGTNSRSQQDIELEVENMGAQLNAYTSREQTTYIARGFRKDSGKMMDVLADILLNSKYDPAKVEAERGVILREMQEVESNLDEVTFDYLHATAYQGTGMGLTILGPSENIEKISQADILNYVKTNYLPSRMVIVGAGGVEHNELVKLAEKYFGHLPPSQSAPEVSPAKYTGSDVRVRDDDVGRCHIALAVEGPSVDSPNYFPIMVANSIIGNWDRSYGGGANLSSKLARAVAQGNLAHSYNHFFAPYKDTGLFGMHMICDPVGIDDMFFAVQNEWMRLCTEISEAEVARGKQQLKAALLMSLDDTVSIAEDIGRQVLFYGRRLPPAELDARIEAIDADVIKEVCTEYIFDADPVVSAVGNVEGVPDYNRIKSGQRWLRY